MSTLSETPLTKNYEHRNNLNDTLEDVDKDFQPPAAKKGRGASRSYELHNSFETKQQALQGLKEFPDVKWLYAYPQKATLFLKFFTNVTKLVVKSLWLTLKATAKIIRHVFSFHDDNAPILGIGHQLVNEIDRLFDVGVKKPNSILKSLHKSGHPQPLKSQLKNHLAQINKKNIASSTSLCPN